MSVLAQHNEREVRFEAIRTANVHGVVVAARYAGVSGATVRRWVEEDRAATAQRRAKTASRKARQAQLLAEQHGRREADRRANDPYRQAHQAVDAAKARIAARPPRALPVGELPVGNLNERYDNGPLRDLCHQTIVKTGQTWTQLADRGGFAGCTALRRAVGLLPEADYRSTGARKVFRRSVSYEVAVRIVRACDAYPVDYGV